MDDELRLLTPCEVVRDALPAKLANTLLKGLVSEAVTWNRGTWYMGGKEHTAPRTSAYYTLHDTKETASVQAFDDNAKDVSASVDKQMAAPELKEAASIVSDHVNRLARRVQSSLASSDRDGWRCSYALCNMYQDGQEGVGPHADRLTTLGPRPIIASLSLGATRIFRIKCMTPQADATTKPVTPSSGWQQSVQLPVSEPLHAAHGRVVHSGMQDAADRMKASQHCMREGVQSIAPKGQQAALHGGDEAVPQQEQQSCPKPGIQSVCSVDVQLPHNTLVIMWPPMQEAWKHEVPKCRHVETHPISGKARINLTFRRLKPEWAAKSPCCRCNQQAVMKASLPSSATSQQRYYFACDNTKGPGCGFFSWAQIVAI
ncbi:MAG: GRF zinc finger domain-containing [Trebouxia sp. A1-2]|nr:MAG: GRF zinc finger domain-containing [Trebouxia sp. A1-2]